MKIGEYFCLFLNSFFPKVPYGRTPRSYSETEYDWAKRSLKLHASHVNLKDKIVLDAGCGLGGRTVFYAENGCELIVGLDISKNGIKHANEFAKEKRVTNTKFTVGSLDALPFESNKFDIIFMDDVVEHIRRPILISSLEECKRVVKVKGRICIEFPPWTSSFAAHLYNDISIPWCHLIFSSRTLFNVLKRMKPGCYKSSFAEFQELNRITIGEFKNTIKKVGFKVINFELHMIKNIRILSYVPFLSKYFTSRVVAVLSK